MKFPAIPANCSVPLLAVLASCLFSLLSILGNPLLNNDAFGYLRAAELFNTAGVRPVLDDYGWYGYSILIALADRVLPGGLLASAQILNTASYALLVFVFIRLCREFALDAAHIDEAHTITSDESRHTRRIEVFAALTILGFPLINEMRYFLIRDFAFWAFALLSLLQLVRYKRSSNLRTAAYWCLALLAAIAFRLEGLLLAVFAPVALLFAAGNTVGKLRQAGKLLGVLLAALLIVFVLMLLVRINLLELMQYAYRYYLPQLYDLTTLLNTTASELNQVMFTADNFPGSGNVAHGLVILIFAYCFTVLVNLVGALSVPFTLLLGYALWRGHLRLSTHLRGPLLNYIATSIFALLLFLFIMRFLTQRYAAFLCILLLTLVPGVLDKMYEQALANNTGKRFRGIVGFFFAYFFIDSLVSFGYSRQYLEEAIAWTADNLPAEARLLTNNYAIAWGSGRIENYDKVALSAALTLQQSASTDYLMLDIKDDDNDIKTLLDGNPQLQLINSFANERGDEVRVYLRH